MEVFCFMPGGELVAAAVAKFVHVKAVENSVEAFLEGGLVKAIQSAKYSTIS